jgi:hypothetical protein
MPAVLFKCLVMRQHVTGWVADDGRQSSWDDQSAVSIACAACTRVHLVNPKTGGVIGADDN